MTGLVSPHASATGAATANRSHLSLDHFRAVSSSGNMSQSLMGDIPSRSASPGALCFMPSTVYSAM